MYTNLDFEKYNKLLEPVASLSRLYSDDEIPFDHSRFAEKLFIA